MPPIKFERTITLEPLVGVDEECNEIAHAQDQIFLNGLRIGYVGHAPLAPVSIIRPGVCGDKPTLAAILEKVAERLGAGERKVCGVPELQSQEAIDASEGITTHADGSET